MKWIYLHSSLLVFLLFFTGCLVIPTNNLSEDISEIFPNENGQCTEVRDIDKIYYSGNFITIGSNGTFENTSRLLVVKTKAKSVDDFLNPNKKKEDVGYLGKKYTRLKQESNINCGQTAATSAIRSYIRDKTGKVFLSQFILNDLMKIIPPNKKTGGTNTMDLARGIAKYLNSKNVNSTKIEVVCNTTYTVKRNGKIIHKAYNGEVKEGKIPIKYKSDKISLKDLMKEQIEKGQHLVLLLKGVDTGTTHFVTFQGVRRVWNEAGGKYFYYVSIMDPWTGKIHELIYRKGLDGKYHLEWDNTEDSEWDIHCYIAISPNNEPVCGDGKIEKGEECDPLSIPNGCVSGHSFCADCKCEYIYWENPIEENKQEEHNFQTTSFCGDGVISGNEECEGIKGNCSLGYLCENCKCKQYFEGIDLLPFEEIENGKMVCWNLTNPFIQIDFALDGKPFEEKVGSNCLIFSTEQISIGNHVLTVTTYLDREELDRLDIPFIFEENKSE